ncbi:hypothetical protein VCRA2119O147_1300005 [Vibrio crassostreae]|nr:hypothetical protein VCRA2112E186_140112 [Vibrio crassostreae]CAK1775940.1 hypothetical protein VCRA2112O185_140114 [Vibrio crassostreae]CAK1957126.1 hypothetical protein VCRA2112O187_270036 [Vibrio crassostreae]CAK2041267.1 hypothetical protein VCRA2112O188_310014 [Vibrio crassostreae]CAK2057733.1 hypothetical protein VCRA2112O184_340036 [Vibrio crassostreae]
MPKLHIKKPAKSWRLCAERKQNGFLRPTLDFASDLTGLWGVLEWVSMFYIVGIRSRLLLEAVQQGREHPKSFLPRSLLRFQTRHR